MECLYSTCEYIRSFYTWFIYPEPSIPGSLIFFFQAEDGIRDDLVTGVQTCALPISCLSRGIFALSRGTIRQWKTCGGYSRLGSRSTGKRTWSSTLRAVPWKKVFLD